MSHKNASIFVPGMAQSFKVDLTTDFKVALVLVGEE
jgi:hypothetical protein